MTSKYLRELMMEQLNAYFTRLCPDLKPTAGYYRDGTRFISDLQEPGVLETLNRDLLIRRK